MSARTLRVMLLGIVTGIAVAVSGFMAIGPARLWAAFGDADLGGVNFENLQRRSTPNDALVCPAGLCKAPTDGAAPVFAVPAQRLQQEFAAAIASEPRLTRIDGGTVPLTGRYIQRSALLGFPDTIVVQFFDRPEGRSTLALYSRSQLGRGDMGVNRKRLERWLTKLVQRLPPLS